MLTGKTDFVTGFAVLALFMLYGFVPILPRDFAPGEKQWFADHAVGIHLKSRLTRGHGNLFALICIAIGPVLLRLSAAWREVRVGAPPFLAVIGGNSLVAALGWAAAPIWRTETAH